MHGLQIRGADVARGRYHEAGRFGRMFPHLRSLKEHTPDPKALGRAGGPMDGGGTEKENARIPAGFVFFGQFVDHDVTFDPTSSLERQNDPKATVNFRTPALELDSVYGAGPDAQPYLYDPTCPGALAVATRTDGDASWPDMPRTSGEGGTAGDARQVAIIGDPRNDENALVSQIHLGMIRFHNAVIGLPQVQALAEHLRFEEAQRLVRWHYQWIVLNEFLPLVCGQEMVSDILKNGRRYFSFESEAYIPVEFSVAAYRFGHSQVRTSYRVGPYGGGDIFGTPDTDLRGNRNLPKRLVMDYDLFFGNGPDVQRSLQIDTKLASPLLDLPETVVPRASRIDAATGQPVVDTDGARVDFAVRSLAERNLRRGLSFSLPSGQAVARYMGETPLEDAELWRGVEGGQGEAPLWFYILREAELQTNGAQLGKVGVRIVAEVLIGLLQGDLASFVNQQPNWQPTLVRDLHGLLTFAGRTGQPQRQAAAAD